MRLNELITDDKKYFPSSPLPDYKADDIYTMDEPVSTDFDNEYADDPMSRLVKDLDDQADIAHGLSTLTDRERYVITMIYGLSGRKPMSLAAIGASMNKLDPDGGVGIGMERVRQIEAKALRKLRHPSRQLNPINEASIFDERTLQNTRWSSPGQLSDWLEKNGFQQKGSGKFGAAFVKAGYNRIIKISKVEDKCWIRFAKWTMNITNQPSLPKISWVKTYRGEGGEQFFLAMVEKLRPFDQFAINNTTDLPGLAYLYLFDFYDKEMTFSASMDTAMEDRFEKEGIITSEDENYDTIRRKLFYFLRTAKKGKRFIMTLKAAERRAVGGCSYDMHDENLMYRPSDRRLVVIDPLADLAAIGGGYS